jgi:D-amino peptidase
MKIYINTDLEGVSSFVDWAEADIKTGRGIQHTKHFLTSEVNAAIKGILDVYPEAEFVVQDGHGGGYWGPNIIAEELNSRAALIQGKRRVEIAGLDETFDLIIGIGAHSMAGTRYGLMNHTIGIDQVMNYWINGVKVGEIGIWAAIAGYYKVAFGMVSGDYWAVVEAKELLGDVEGAAVKKGINMYTAQCLNPITAREKIMDASRSAATRISQFKPLRFEAPFEVKIEYTNTNYADSAEFERGGTRLDGRTIIFKGDDLLHVINQA